MGDLTSWRDGAAKEAIVGFVARVCGEDGSEPVPAEQALEQAASDGWTVISVKRDWATVF